MRFSQAVIGEEHGKAARSGHEAVAVRSRFEPIENARDLAAGGLSFFTA
jgi:hypothetical protein